MKGDHIGEFEELVLLTIQGLDEDAYGVSIKTRLDRETRREISLGAVYAALDRLEAKGLVDSAVTPGAAVRGGRSRRSFVVTPEGRRTLRHLRSLRDRLWRAALAREES
ncbi:MAG TPA: helix-turn-helix transcriptional regulator [Vicinamibacterales bacterium]|nr:helix-turn-helix transcriptional regulator [Vicinamibacterales bacterium]